MGLLYLYIDHRVGLLEVVKVRVNLIINPVVYWTVAVTQCIFMSKIYFGRAYAMLTGCGVGVAVCRADDNSKGQFVT
jgi:hypothetical protein